MVVATFPVGLLRDVQVHEVGRAASGVDGACRIAARRLLQVADHHGGAGLGQCLRHAGAQALGAPGHQGAAARQGVVRHCVSELFGQLSE
jgi:hypothetical protein